MGVRKCFVLRDSLEIFAVRVSTGWIIWKFKPLKSFGCLLAWKPTWKGIEEKAVASGRKRMVRQLGFPGFEDAGWAPGGVTWLFLSHLEHSHPLRAPAFCSAEVKVVSADSAKHGPDHEAPLGWHIFTSTWDTEFLSWNMHYKFPTCNHVILTAWFRRSVPGLANKSWRHVWTKWEIVPLVKNRLTPFKLSGLLDPNMKITPTNTGKIREQQSGN